MNKIYKREDYLKKIRGFYDDSETINNSEATNF